MNELMDAYGEAKGLVVAIGILGWCGLVFATCVSTFLLGRVWVSGKTLVSIWRGETYA